MTTLTYERPTRPSVVGTPVAEYYRALVHRLRALKGADRLAAISIGVTSCDRGVGVSTIAGDLAIAAAQSSEGPVLLLDLTGTRPQLATRLGMEQDLGLREALTIESDPAPCAVVSPIANLSVLAASDFFAVTANGVDDRKTNELLSKLGNSFELIVVDLPPVGSTVTLAISETLDGVIFVVEAQQTNAARAAQAKDQLVDANAAVIGTILNKTSPALPEWLDKIL